MNDKLLMTSLGRMGTGNHEGKIETFEHFCYVGGGGDCRDSRQSGSRALDMVKHPGIRSNMNNRRTRSLLSTP